MEVGILSMRYAKAMIEYAQEKGVDVGVYQEFLTLSHSFCAQPGPVSYTHLTLPTNSRV